MFDRLSLSSLGVVGLLSLVLGGCGSSNQVAFTNVSDSWLNVRFFVGTEGTEDMNSAEFVSDTKMQIKPGATVNYALTSNPNYTAEEHSVVHVQVQPVGPSWQPTTAEYWLELLTPPPVTIVATGRSEDLTFDTGDGAVALIPDREIDGGRFEHKMVTAPEMDAPE